MMPSLLDDPDVDFLVVVNDEHQYSLWPVPLAVPEGWIVVHGPADRAGALGYVRKNWIDMRPLSAR